MAEVTGRVVKEIPASIIRQTVTRASMIEQIPVAAYARVSTDRVEQEDSFERQVDYYTRYINSKAEWKFVGIYADPGITGTRTDKRKEFQRMMNDAKEGKIKKILCKSITRFARNTVDALQSIRVLKEIGVSVYFETQNIDTLSPGGEVLITILAAMAEQESRTISTNIKWAYQKKFQNGEVQLNYSRFLGYTKGKSGELEIIPEEASIVKRIYREFLFGRSAAQIAKELTEDGVPTPCMKPDKNGNMPQKKMSGKWFPSTIRSILKNEKYMGCAILGKTYKPDVLSKKRYKNNGQVEQYYVENSHPAIIDKETFEMVQAEIKARQGLTSCTDNNRGRYSSKYAFSRVLYCECCGMPFRRHAQIVKGKYAPTWTCATRQENGKTACPQKYLAESDVEDAFLAVLRVLVGNEKALKHELMDNVVTNIDDNTAERLQRVLTEIDNLQTAIVDLNRKKRAGTIGMEEYQDKCNEAVDRLDRMQAQRDELFTKRAVSKLTLKRVEDMNLALDGVELMDKFDRDIFTALVKRITAKGRTLTFEFRVGVKESITI